MERTVRRFQKGQGLVEYALVLVLVALVALLILNLTGVSIADVFNRIIAALGGKDTSCDALASPGKQWDGFEDKNWKGGVTQQAGGGYQVCPYCGGLLPGFSGSDYQVDLKDVKVKITNPTWNGYGVTFRSELGDKGLNGYSFEVEKVNRNNPTRIYFTKWVNGIAVKPPLKMLYLPADIDWNNPPDMSVKVEGDTFTAFMDGKQVLQGKDKTYTKGSAGVFSNAGSQLEFSNLPVSPLGCEQVK